MPIGFTSGPNALSEPKVTNALSLFTTKAERSGPSGSVRREFQEVARFGLGISPQDLIATCPGAYLVSYTECGAFNVPFVLSVAATGGACWSRIPIGEHPDSTDPKRTRREVPPVNVAVVLNALLDCEGSMGVCSQTGTAHKGSRDPANTFITPGGSISGGRGKGALPRTGINRKSGGWEEAHRKNLTSGCHNFGVTNQQKKMAEWCTFERFVPIINYENPQLATSMYEYLNHFYTVKSEVTMGTKACNQVASSMQQYDKNVGIDIQQLGAYGEISSTVELMLKAVVSKDAFNAFLLTTSFFNGPLTDNDFLRFQDFIRRIFSKYTNDRSEGPSFSRPGYMGSPENASSSGPNLVSSQPKLGGSLKAYKYIKKKTKKRGGAAALKKRGQEMGSRVNPRELNDFMNGRVDLNELDSTGELKRLYDEHTQLMRNIKERFSVDLCLTTAAEHARMSTSAIESYDGFMQKYNELSAKKYVKTNDKIELTELIRAYCSRGFLVTLKDSLYIYSTNSAALAPFLNGLAIQGMDNIIIDPRRVPYRFSVYVSKLQEFSIDRYRGFSEKMREVFEKVQRIVIKNEMQLRRNTQVQLICSFAADRTITHLGSDVDLQDPLRLNCLFCEQIKKVVELGEQSMMRDNIIEYCNQELAILQGTSRIEDEIPIQAYELFAAIVPCLECADFNDGTLLKSDMYDITTLRRFKERVVTGEDTDYKFLIPYLGLAPAPPISSVAKPFIAMGSTQSGMTPNEQGTKMAEIHNWSL